MDESGSVQAEEFEREKNFVKGLADHFQLGPRATQFGVITFSTQAQLDIMLNQYSSLSSFQSGVNKIKYKGIRI